MIVILSKCTGGLYRRVIKPILFKIQPDTVHRFMLRIAGFLQRLTPILWLTTVTFSYRNKKLLAQDIATLHFKNPIGLSAGFDKNIELLPILKSIGFGFVEGGSITYRPCAGNDRPWFYRLPNTKSIVVHVGLANEGSAAITKRIANYKLSLFKDFILNISIAKTNSRQTVTTKQGITDYVNSLRAIKSKGVGDLVTLNISCPNTYGGEPYTTPERLEQLLQGIDAVGYKKPIFIKMPCLDWSEIKPLVTIAARHHITGLTFSNLAKDRASIALRDPLPDTVKGGLSGKPTWHQSNELIRQTYVSFPNRFVLSGVGGIFTAEDAYTKIRLGANIVELVTGLIFEGPQLIGQMNRELAKLLQRDGFTNVSQAVGVDAKKTVRYE